MNWTAVLVIVAIIVSILMNMSVEEPMNPVERGIAIAFGAIIIIVVVLVTIGILGVWAVWALVAFAIAEGCRGGDGIQ